ncbi:MAG TPA: hypothetical protein VIY27_03265 [Myxococcota bacterium]
MARRHHYRRRTSEPAELDMTTFLNLMVAIPLLITNTVLTAKTGEIIDSLEMASVKALNVISAKAKRQVEA